MDCPVCGTRAVSPGEAAGGGLSVQCPCCGPFQVSPTALTVLAGSSMTPERRTLLAHKLCRLPPGSMLTTDLIDNLLDAGGLPDPLEQVDLLIQYMASKAPAGHEIHLSGTTLKGWLGCADSKAAHWVVRQAQDLRFMTAAGGETIFGTLTLAGWQRHQALLRDGAGSRHAFMAMKFGDEQLDRLYRDHIREAVASAGFDLRTTAGPHQTAGSIDDRMRVEIRTSRFLVCDLTHGNRGAYWEAGFAEGIGRPVFYICRRDVQQSQDSEIRPHFDTAHQLILGWAEETIADDMAALKAAIRATLPTEATLED